MHEPAPLPFRLKVPEEESWELSGISTTSYKVEGLLKLADLMVILEWTGEKSVEQFGFAKIGTDVEKLPVDWLEVPAEEIANVHVTGLWSPKLELVAHNMDTFEDVPSARGPILQLRLRRRDKSHARDMAVAIRDAAQEARLLPAEDTSQLEAPDAWDSQEY